MPDQQFQYEKDPRFKFTIVKRGDGAWKYVDPKGDSSEFNPATAKPWVDIGMPTQLADMKSILQGRGGTSEGDSWSPTDIQNVKGLALKTGGVANEALVNAYKELLLRTKDPHFMSQHPGRAAYNVDSSGQ